MYQSMYNTTGFMSATGMCTLLCTTFMILVPNILDLQLCHFHLLAKNEVPLQRPKQFISGSTVWSLGNQPGNTTWVHMLQGNLWIKKNTTVPNNTSSSLKAGRRHIQMPTQFSIPKLLHLYQLGRKQKVVREAARRCRSQLRAIREETEQSFRSRISCGHAGKSLWETEKLEESLRNLDKEDGRVYAHSQNAQLS